MLFATSTTRATSRASRSPSMTWRIVAVGDGDHPRAGRLWGAARHLTRRGTGTSLADYVERNFDMFGVPSPREAIAPGELDILAAAGRRDGAR